MEKVVNSVDPTSWPVNRRNYLVAGAQSMHCTNLLRRQCFAEQVNSSHLAAEHTLLIQFGCRTDVALVERLSYRRQRQKIQSRKSRRGTNEMNRTTTKKNRIKNARKENRTIICVESPMEPNGAQTMGVHENVMRWKRRRKENPIKRDYFVRCSHRSRIFC